MKETAMDGGIKLLFILEDFLDKNREQFNDLENSNMVMKRRLEELESQSNNFLGLVNKVEQENLNLKREQRNLDSRFSPALNNSYSREFTVNKKDSYKKDSYGGISNRNNNQELTRRLE